MRLATYGIEQVVKLDFSHKYSLKTESKLSLSGLLDNIGESDLKFIPKTAPK